LPWLLHLYFKDLRGVVAKDVHHLDYDPVLSWLLIGVRVGGERQGPVLAGTVGYPSLHEGVILDVPVHGLVINLVGSLLDFGTYFFGNQLGVRNDEVFARSQWKRPVTFSILCRNDPRL
jgi:hypothetical protein